MAGSSEGRKAAQWRRRMERFARSGESVARFCEHEGVSAPSFYQWRKKLAEPSAASGAAGFAAVRVVASPAVTVRLPGGTEIELPTAADDATGR